MKMRLSRIRIFINHALRLLAISAVSILIMTACDRSSGLHREDVPKEENGGKEDTGNTPDTSGDGSSNSGDRPGFDEFDSDRELSDSGFRYHGSGFTLRFDDCGVLIKIHADGTRELINIEGTERIIFSSGEMTADSLFNSAALTVKGVNIAIKKAMLKKQTAETVWYHIIDTSSNDHVIVLP